MELLVVILIVIVAVALLVRGPALFRRGPRTVVRPALRRRVADDAAWRDQVVADDRVVDDDPVRRRTVIDEY